MFEEHLQYDFINEIIYCCLTKKRFIDSVEPHLKTNFIVDENQRKLFEAIVHHYRAHDTIPSFGILKLALRKEQDCLMLINHIKSIEVEESDDILKNLEDFVRNCEFVELFDQTSTLYNKGKKEVAIDSYLKGAERLRKFSLQANNFKRVYRDFTERQMRRAIDKTNNNADRIPTGIVELDRKVRGGFELTNFVLFVADSKAGKSFLLQFCGYTASKLGYDVLHFQIEGTEKECLERYDACWSGTDIYDVKDAGIPAKAYDNLNKFLKKETGEIHVYAAEKFDGLNMKQVRNLVVDFKANNVIKKGLVVILDYLELCSPDEKHYDANSERFRQTKTARYLKELAMQENCLVYSATQTSNIPRELLNDSDFVITRDNLAEDKGKVRPVDALISINCTAQEQKEGVRRLFIDADRGIGVMNQLVFIKTALRIGRFYNHKTTEEFLDEIAHLEDDEEQVVPEKKQKPKATASAKPKVVLKK